MSVNGWDAFSSDAPFCHRTGTAAASILSDYMPRSSRVLLKPGGITSTAIEAFDETNFASHSRDSKWRPKVCSLVTICTRTLITCRRKRVLKKTTAS